LLELTEAQDAEVQPLLNAAAMVSNFALRDLTPLLGSTLIAAKAARPLLKTIAMNTRRIDGESPPFGLSEPPASRHPRRH
jgi:hypothetical protein